MLAVFLKAPPAQPALFQAPINTATPDHGGRLKPVKQTIQRKDGKVYTATRWVLPAAAPSAAPSTEPDATPSTRAPVEQSGLFEARNHLSELASQALTLSPVFNKIRAHGFELRPDPGGRTWTLYDATLNTRAGPRQPGDQPYAIVGVKDPNDARRWMGDAWFKTPLGRHSQATPWTAEDDDISAPDAAKLRLAAAAQQLLDAATQNTVAAALEAGDTDSALLLAKLTTWAGSLFQPSDLKDPVGEAPRRLTRCDAATEAAVQKRLKDTHDDRQHGDFRLDLIAAYDLDYQHPAFTKKAADLGNVKSLYHGVNKFRSLAVVATGLKTPKEVGTVTGSMFGPGIYLAEQSSKSGQYLGDRFSHRDTEGVLLECDAVLGHEYAAKSGGGHAVPAGKTGKRAVKALRAYKSLAAAAKDMTRFAAIAQGGDANAKERAWLADSQALRGTRFDAFRGVELYLTRMRDTLKSFRLGDAATLFADAHVTAITNQLKDAIAAYEVGADLRAAAEETIMGPALTADELRIRSGPWGPTVPAEIVAHHALRHIYETIQTAIDPAPNPAGPRIIPKLRDLRDDLYTDLAGTILREADNVAAGHYEKVTERIQGNWARAVHEVVAAAHRSKRPPLSDLSDDTIAGIIRAAIAKAVADPKGEARHVVPDRAAKLSAARLASITDNDSLAQTKAALDATLATMTDKKLMKTAPVYHSTRGLTREEGGHLKNPEWAVYDQDQVHVRRVLLVKRVDVRGGRRP